MYTVFNSAGSDPEIKNIIAAHPAWVIALSEHNVLPNVMLVDDKVAIWYTSLKSRNF